VRQFFSGWGENLGGPGPWPVVPRKKGRARKPVGRTQSVHYRDARDRQPVKEFIKALPKRHGGKVEDQIEEHLNGRPADAPPPGFPMSSQIENELRELRIQFSGIRYRILYQRSRNLIVLLHAFEKNTSAVPASDKAAAKWRMADFKRRIEAVPRKPPRPLGDDAP
jgi:phage-related protein